MKKFFLLLCTLATTQASFFLVTRAWCNAQAFFYLLYCMFVAMWACCTKVFLLVCMLDNVFSCYDGRLWLFFFPTFLLLLCWLRNMWLRWGTTTLDWHKFDKLLINFGFVGKFVSLWWRCSKSNLIWGHMGSRKI